MKRTVTPLTIISLLLLSGSSSAQTLNQSNCSMVPGVDIPMVIGAYQDAGPSGTGQTWSFAGVGNAGAAHTVTATPASTGQGSVFTTSTVAQVDDGANATFMHYSATGASIDGVYSASFGITIHYTDPEVFIAFPCSYNTTWTDQFYAAFDEFGSSIVRSGSISGTADGSGSVVLPTGTVSNVLRVKSHEVFGDVVDGSPDYSYDYTTWNFYRPGTPYPIAQVANDITTIQGSSNTTQSLHWLNDASIGMEDLFMHDIGVDLAPNPANSSTRITYGFNGTLDLRMVDATGRTVYTEKLPAEGEGIHTHDLDLNGIVPGIYSVTLTATNGQQGVRRLIVN